MKDYILWWAIYKEMFEEFSMGWVGFGVHLLYEWNWDMVDQIGVFDSTRTFAWRLDTIDTIFAVDADGEIS